MNGVVFILIFAIAFAFWLGKVWQKQWVKEFACYLLVGAFCLFLVYGLSCLASGQVYGFRWFVISGLALWVETLVLTQTKHIDH